MATTTYFHSRAYGDERLVRAAFQCAAAFAKSASDFWTVTLRLRRYKPSGELQSYGGTVGTFSTETRNVTAGEEHALYENEQGLPMRDGEELWVTLASTGSPAVLSGPSVTTDSQPITR